MVYYIMKICSTCKIEKPKTSFSKNKNTKDGLMYICRVCNSLQNKAWVISNPEKQSIRVRNWYSKNKELHLTRSKIHGKTYRSRNRSKLNSRESKRRATKLQATPPWADTWLEKLLIEELYLIARIRSYSTGLSYQVDHIIPLNSDTVQGFHCFINLQILESEKNQSKSNRTWPDMP